MVRDLAVREEGDVAVVSFLLDTPHQRTRFIVDMWKGEMLLCISATQRN